MTICDEQEGTYFDKVLQSALHHARPEKRIEMVYILGEFHDDRALRALETIMNEDDPYLVSKAVEAVGKIGGVGAIKLLLMMMHHPSFIVRGEVATALSKIDHPMRDEMLRQLLSDPSRYVADCANLVLNCSNI